MSALPSDFEVGKGLQFQFKPSSLDGDCTNSQLRKYAEQWGYSGKLGTLYHKYKQPECRSMIDVALKPLGEGMKPSSPAVKLTPEEIRDSLGVPTVSQEKAEIVGNFLATSARNLKSKTVATPTKALLKGTPESVESGIKSPDMGVGRPSTESNPAVSPSPRGAEVSRSIVQQALSPFTPEQVAAVKSAVKSKGGTKSEKKSMRKEMFAMYEGVETPQKTKQEKLPPLSRDVELGVPMISPVIAKEIKTVARGTPFLTKMSKLIPTWLSTLGGVETETKINKAVDAFSKKQGLNLGDAVKLDTAAKKIQKLLSKNLKRKSDAATKIQATVKGHQQYHKYAKAVGERKMKATAAAKIGEVLSSAVGRRQKEGMEMIRANPTIAEVESMSGSMLTEMYTKFTGKTGKKSNNDKKAAIIKALKG